MTTSSSDKDNQVTKNPKNQCNQDQTVNIEKDFSKIRNELINNENEAANVHSDLTSSHDTNASRQFVNPVMQHSNSLNDTVVEQCSASQNTYTELLPPSHTSDFNIYTNERYISTYSLFTSSLQLIRLQIIIMFFLPF